VDNKIETAADLQWLRDNLGQWTATWTQTANIDMGGCDWATTAIGTSANKFAGAYIGGGFEVSGLTVDSAPGRMGLFGVVSGQISNLGFTGDVTTSTTAGYAVGGLVGELVGVSASITNSYSTGNVKGTLAVGGLVGVTDSGATITITNSYATGNVESTTSSSFPSGTGGLVGYAKGGSIKNSHATGQVTGGGTNANSGTGGLVGITSSATITITDSYATGPVTGVVNVGGLVGTLGSNSGTVSQSYATGDVETTGTDPGDGTAGGLIGQQTNTSTVVRSFATGNITGTSTSEHLAGLVGAAGNITVTDSFATGGIVGGNEQIGGLIGDLTSGTFTRSYSATLTGIANSLMLDDSLGGVAGNVSTGTFTMIAWDGDTAAGVPLITDSWGRGGSTQLAGKTTAEMTDIATYIALGWNDGFARTIAAGYDLSYTWGICSAFNAGYPFLTGIYSTDPCTGGGGGGGGSTGTTKPAEFEFTFWLPNGEECTRISPVTVVDGTDYALPGKNALCQTMPGALVGGWTIPVDPEFTGAGSVSLPFNPGHIVKVSSSQRFTVVPFEPVLTLELDSNVAIGEKCVSGGVEVTEGSQRIEYVWVPRELISIARLPMNSACSPEGYTVAAWNTEANGSGKNFDLGSEIPSGWGEGKDNVLRFYAVWEVSHQFVTTNLTEAAFFERHSKELTSTGKSRLDKLIAVAPNGSTDVKVVIVGAAATNMSLSDNERLAALRTEVISSYFLRNGVSGDFTRLIAREQMSAWSNENGLSDSAKAAGLESGIAVLSSTGRPLTTVRISFRVPSS
jgi:hypothetical protein